MKSNVRRTNVCKSKEKICSNYLPIIPPWARRFKATAWKFHKLNLCRERRISDVLTRDLNLNGRAFKVNRFDAKNLSTHPPKSWSMTDGCIPWRPETLTIHKLALAGWVEGSSITRAWLKTLIQVLSHPVGLKWREWRLINSHKGSREELQRLRC